MISRIKEALNLFQKGQLNESKEICFEILKNQADSFDALYLSGMIAFRQREYIKSEESIRKAINLRSNNAEIYNVYAIVLLHLKKFNLAIENWNKAIKLRPDYLEAYNNRGNLLLELGKTTEALKNYEKAIELKPDFAEAYNNLGNALLKLKKIDSALKSYEKAINLMPNYYQAYHNIGRAFYERNKKNEELKSYEKSSKFSSDIESALKNYKKALEIKPDFAEAYFDLGSIFSELNKNDVAIEYYEKAIRSKKEFEAKLGTLIHTKLKLCDWSTIEKDLKDVENKIINLQNLSSPFFLLSIKDSLKLQKINAEKWFKNEFSSSHSNLEKTFKKYNNKKIKIGYYSADFREHAMGHLLANLFELHDRSKFEIYGFYFGPDSNDNVFKRISNTFDNFININLKTDIEIVQLSRDFEIDIAIDLMGYTRSNRFKIFAERCAPIQVNYLGYPGTSGSDCIDYIIVDKILIPKESQKYYSEKIVYLPNSYQANDSKKEISKKIFTREELGLPKNSFVFCSFNQRYKILPKTFNIWMQILKRIDNSVIWLLESNEKSSENLKNEAAKRGIDSNRVIFSKALPLDQHLARHKAADLFIDTFPYNAHTTCSDSLRAGLPVLTLQGETFASRVASSLLNAVGLKELITHSNKEFEDLAVQLASDFTHLKKIKNKLDVNKDKLSLFNTKLFTSHIEQAYLEMYKRYNENQKPENIEIK